MPSQLTSISSLSNIKSAVDAVTISYFRLMLLVEELCLCHSYKDMFFRAHSNRLFTKAFVGPTQVSLTTLSKGLPVM